MISLRIHHRTTYRYRTPVSFGPHRLMLRPRETRELRLSAFELTTTPQASVSWAHDVWGNGVASANFQATGDTVAIESVAQIELDAVARSATARHTPGATEPSALVARSEGRNAEASLPYLHQATPLPQHDGGKLGEGRMPFLMIGAVGAALAIRRLGRLQGEALASALPRN
jgi:transglutaminase-like putative cysteine protease